MGWLDDFISAWRILVNGTEQAIPKRVNYIGDGITSEKVGDQLNLTFATGGTDITGSSSILIDAGVASCIFGATSSTCCVGNDDRLSVISTGFVNRTSSAISLSGSTFTITGTNFEVWPNLTTKVLRSTESKSITNVVGTHWIFYDSAGTLTCTPPSSGFPGFDKALVANVYWDGTKALGLGDERHGCVMDTASHELWHTTVGTRFDSGFAVVRLATGTGGADNDARLVLDGGIIRDEDIKITISRGSAGAEFTQEIGLVAGSIPARIPVYYRTGADGHWTKDVATTFPMKQWGGAGTRIAYNKNTGGTWSAADPAVDGAIVAMWLMATNDRYEPIIAIMGQRADVTGNTAAILLAAQNGNQYSSLDFGNLPFQEMKVLYRALVKTHAGYANAIRAYIVEFQDLRTVGTIASGTYVATDHNSLSGRSNEAAHPASAISPRVDDVISGGAFAIGASVSQLSGGGYNFAPTGAKCCGIALSAASAGGQTISVQSTGDLLIPDSAWELACTAFWIGYPVYAWTGGVTLTKNVTPGEYYQEIGTVWHSSATANTTVVRLNLGPLQYNIAI